MVLLRVNNKALCDNVQYNVQKCIPHVLQLGGDIIYDVWSFGIISASQNDSEKFPFHDRNQQSTRPQGSK